MFPIGDDRIRGARTPWVNILLIIINVLVFFYEITLSDRGLQQFITNYGVVPVEIMQGQNVLTLFTSIFVHGGWLHLIGNMLFLWVFGDNIEASLGHIGYLLFYLAGGLAASAAHILLNMGSNVPSVGASGAIAATLGSYLVMFPRSRIRVLLFLAFFITTTRITAVVFLGIWAVMQLFNGVAALGAPTAQTTGVAYWAHIGGFVFGVLVGFLFRGRAADLVPVNRRY